MSRPCFALSVMLCCMGGPLLIIGKTQAQDSVSPSHDPGECIVCPLAHGPLEPCGGYSDYDYNRYWYDEYSPAVPEATTPATPELEVAQSLNDVSSDQAWESDYDDYYADYVYGDEASIEDAEDLALAAAPDTAQAKESSEYYDEDGWYEDEATASQDYFDAYDNYEPIAPTAPVNSLDDESFAEEGAAEEGAIDYEAFEDEWFSYDPEPTVDVSEVMEPVVDEAYEALSEPASEVSPAAAEPTRETWGDEDAWYCETYGYEGSIEETSIESAARAEPTMPLETGYDEAYDDAMATAWEAAAPVAEIATPAPAPPAPTGQPSDDSDSYDDSDYESYYDAYDDLYDFDSAPSDALETEANEATPVPAINEHAQPATTLEPAWLTELVSRMLTPAWATADNVDLCAQEWDCNADNWAQPQPEQPSVVLSAADTLDELALLLQNAAELLRGSVGGRLAEMARAAQDESAR